jgi:hypothetical protein
MAAFSDRVFDRQFFFIPQKVIKPADGHQMAIDRFRRQLLSQKMVDVRTYFLMGDLLDRLIDPNHELFQVIQITPEGVG